MKDLEYGLGLISSLGWGVGSGGLTSVSRRDSDVLLTLIIGFTSFSVDTLDSDSCDCIRLCTKRLVIGFGGYSFGCSTIGSFYATRGGCSVSILERLQGFCLWMGWYTLGNDSYCATYSALITQVFIVSILKVSVFLFEPNTVGTTLSGVLSTFSSFFYVNFNSLSLVSRLPKGLLSIFLAPSAPLRSVAKAGSGGGSFILIVLLFCSISLFLENLAGVFLFVSCISCCISYGILTGVLALLRVPFTKRLVEPRKTLLMSPMALSPSKGLGAGVLFVREELVDWQADVLLLSTSWKMTFLSRAETLFGSSLSLLLFSSVWNGSIMGEGLVRSL